jgi:hypothetical protein
MNWFKPIFTYSLERKEEIFRRCHFIPARNFSKLSINKNFIANLETEHFNPIKIMFWKLWRGNLIFLFWKWRKWRTIKYLCPPAKSFCCSAQLFFSLSFYINFWEKKQLRLNVVLPPRLSPDEFFLGLCV